MDLRALEQMHEEKVIEAERKFAADVAAKKKKDPKYDVESDKVRTQFTCFSGTKVQILAEKKKMTPKYDALLDEVRSLLALLVQKCRY